MGFINKFSFGVIGENVTLKIRMELYERILRKDIGWFDNKENSGTLLNSIIASDTSVINGVSTESLGTMLESMVGMFSGIGIGFYYCW